MHATGLATALLLVVVMAAYFAAVNHISLPPWNHLSHGRSQLASTAVGTIPAGLVVLALLRGQGLPLAAIWMWIWLLLQIRQWWLPHRDCS